MRILYSIGIWLYAFVAKIWALKNHKARLWIAGRKESFVKLHAVFAQNSQPVIWFHAASLGEFEQGRPIIEQFRKQHPDWKILLTFFSPSGYEIRKTYAHADCVAYLPLDTPRNAKKLLRLVQPQIAVFIKYEFWYNYLNALKKQGVQTFFVSTIFRPSQYFFKGYGVWFRKQLRKISYFFVQNEESKKLLNAINLRHVSVSGDTRFDRVTEILQNKTTYPIIENFKGNQKMCIIGSSWKADETLMGKVIPQFPKVKFLFVPHEIDEAHLQNLERLLLQPALRFSRVNAKNISDAQIMIVDEIGHLSQLYQYGDMAYIGGGFEKSEIHNILEAAVFGMPILFGPNYQKFQEAHDLIALNVAKSVSTSEEIIPFLQNMETQNPAYIKACEQSANYVKQKTGATNLVMKNLEECISVRKNNNSKKRFEQKILRSLVLLFFAIGCSIAGFGQVQPELDSVDITTDSAQAEQSITKKEGGSANSGTVFYFYESPFNCGIPELRFVDTTKSFFHRNEPTLENNYFRADRGNIGLPTEELEYFYKDNILFSHGKNLFDLYRYKYSNTQFYQNVNPYVELFYVMGKQKEQNFRVLYAQNIWRGLNVGAEYHAISAPGVYSRTFTRHNNARIFSNFISKDRHYRAVAGYYFNKIDVNENGGITIPYDSMAFAPTNPNFISVNLQQAENSWKEHSFYFKQSYHFGMHRNDSIPNSGVNFGYLSHSLEVTRYRTIYRDQDLLSALEGFYPAVYGDSTQTYDSTFVGLIRNTFSWNIGDVTSYQNAQFFNLSIGAIADMARVNDGLADQRFDKNYNAIYPFAKLRLNYQNQYFLSAGAMLSSSLDDFSANAQFRYIFRKSKPSEHAYFEGNYSDVQPRPFQTFYFGNHYRWDTTFENFKTLHFAAGARWKGFHLRGEMATFNGYLSLSELNYKQTAEAFSVFKVTLEKTFKYRFLALDTRLVYQLRPTGKVMQLPKFATRNAFYFDFVLLRATPMQVGVEMYYHTPYLSRAYNPVLGTFYGQSDFETGGFVYLDAFINLRVQRRANLFLKWANFATRWLGDNYTMTVGYPTVERAIEFGVLWRFYD